MGASVGSMNNEPDWRGIFWGLAVGAAYSLLYCVALIGLVALLMEV